ncbi:MAG TPA: outer membrane beta-barrel protein [Terricaulis sp.]|nr:outer membrane beta-barrel protein [Terricaulis sp.]
MKSRITKTVALAALMAGTAGVANATEGWYGRLDLGYTTGGEFDIGTDGAWNYGSPDLEADMSQHVGLGYAFQNGLRIEGEVGHRWNEIESLANLDSGGDVHAWSAMLNFFYDFNRNSRVNPYIGVGVGGVRLNVNGADSAPLVRSFDDEDTVLGYQAMIGLGIGVTERLTLDVGYRALWAPEVEFLSNQPAPVTREADYEHQAVTVGLRWQFAGAAPPPPPPPQVAATCPTGNYVVYFEWDRSTLNTEALAVIDRAASSLANCNLGGIVLVGHTDTSGSTAYNQGLSERRASVVRDALVARGVAAGAVTTQARGESDLARATADGVREPLNRRTAITITFR